MILWINMQVFADVKAFNLTKEFLSLVFHKYSEQL